MTQSTPKNLETVFCAALYSHPNLRISQFFLCQRIMQRIKKELGESNSNYEGLAAKKPHSDNSEKKNTESPS